MKTISKKTKISLIASGIGALGATVVSVPLALASDVKTNVEVPQHTSSLANAQTTSASIYGYPNGLTHKDLFKQFDNSKEGFIEIFSTLEKIYSDIKVDTSALSRFYDENTQKAMNLITYANTALTHRGFWDSIWSGIKGTFVAIGAGIVTTVDGLTGGQINDVHQTSNKLIKETGDLFNQASELMNKVNWISVGAWWLGLATKSLDVIETLLTHQHGLSDAATQAEINNILLPFIKDEIAKQAPSYINNYLNDPFYKQVLEVLNITNDELINSISIGIFNGDEKVFGNRVENKDYPYDFGIATYLYGVYKFKVSIDFSKISHLDQDNINMLNNLANSEIATLVKINIHP